MIQIYIFADSYKHFQNGISEYTKRLRKDLQVIELKPVKKGTPQQIIASETQILSEKIQNTTGYKIILSPSGTNLSTLEFTTLIETQKNSGNKISFFIGGANGLDYEKLELHADFELSLGKMTLPHGLALTMLLEQVYRCREIERGSGYHK